VVESAGDRMMVKRKKITTTKETKVMMTVLFAVLILTMVYTVYSLISWRNFERRYVAWPPIAQDTLDHVLGLPAGNDNERVIKLVELKKVDSELLQRSDHLCDTRLLWGWQAGIVSHMKGSETECKDTRAKIAPVIAAYDQVVSYLEEEAVIGGLINTPLLQPSSDNEKKWQEQAVAWKNLNEKLEKLEASTAFKLAKEKIQGAVKNVSSAWNGVLVANDSKDPARYLRAASQLSTAYDDLRAILEGIDQDNGAYKQRLEVLDRAYQITFN
jgi:hypothetical protein